MDKKSVMDVVISVLISCVVLLVLIYVFHGMQRENFRGELDEYKHELTKSFEKISSEIAETRKEIDDLHEMISNSAAKKPEFGSHLGDMNLEAADVMAQEHAQILRKKDDSSAASLPEHDADVKAPEMVIDSPKM